MRSHVVAKLGDEQGLKNGGYQVFFEEYQGQGSIWLSTEIDPTDGLVIGYSIANQESEALHDALTVLEATREAILKRIAMVKIREEIDQSLESCSQEELEQLYLTLKNQPLA